MKKIYNMIGATITASSIGRGFGSTFTLSLKRDKFIETKNTFSFRVLVIDDSSVIIKLLSHYLSSMGCDVVSNISVEEARKKLAGFDVIFTDGSMGGQSGTDFIKDIRGGLVTDAPCDIPIVLCSGEKHEIEDERTHGKTFLQRRHSDHPWYNR